MEQEKSTNIWQGLKRSLRIINNVSKTYLFIAITMTIVSSVVPIVSMLTMQEIVNDIQLGIQGEQLNTIVKLVVFYILIDVFHAIVQAIWQQYSLKFSLRFKLDIDTKIQRKLEHMSLSNYENSQIYNDLQLAKMQGNSQILDYITQFVSFIGNIVSIVSHVFILITFRWWIVGIIMILPLIKYKLNNKYNKEQYEAIKGRTTESRKTWYWDFLMTSGQNFKELKNHHLFDHFIHLYKEMMERFNKQDIGISKRRNIVLTILTIVELLLNGLIFSFVIFIGYLGEILIGNIITYTKSIMSTQSGIDSVLKGMSQIKQSSFYINLFFNFMDLPERKKEGEEMCVIEHIRTIEVKNLSFRYFGKEEYAIKNISFKINENEIFVIVGENGSGKTTLAKLIMGFYDDYEGDILINGMNLRNIDKEQYLTLIATVFQDFIKYEATVRENITYGNLKELNNDKKLKNVLCEFKNSALDIDSQVGNWFDNGAQISAGQWQKLALSRAFIKNADLYILDEPNAALDPISEYEIAQLYEYLLKDKMGIIIAHKFNNLTLYADSIVVLEKGELIEQGNHSALMGEKGRYHQLFQLQSGKKSLEIH